MLGGQEPKIAQNHKKTRCALYLMNHASYRHLWFADVKGQYLQVFKIFFPNLVFGVNSGVKRQKMAQNDKKLCLSYSVSQKACII